MAPRMVTGIADADADHAGRQEPGSTNSRDCLDMPAVWMGPKTSGMAQRTATGTGVVVAWLVPLPGPLQPWIGDVGHE